MKPLPSVLVYLVLPLGMSMVEPGVSAREPWEPPRLEMLDHPELCDTVSSPEESETAIVVASGQVFDLYVTTVDGIDYSLGVDPENLIRYISTDVPDFTTPEGVAVGWTRSQLESAFEAEVACERGWACFLELPSGWCAAFRISNTKTQEKMLVYETVMPALDDKVTWFFRRGACGE